MKYCKECGAICQDKASRCSSCNAQFPVETNESAKQKKSKKKNKSTPHPFAIFIILLISGIVILSIGLVFGEAVDSLPGLLICWASLLVILFSLIYFFREDKNTHSASETSGYKPAFDSNTSYAKTTNEQSRDNRQNLKATNNGFVATLDDVRLQGKLAPLPKYDAEIDFKSAALQLSGKTESLNLSTARSLIAAIAARRMVVLCCNTDIELEHALANIEALTGETPSDVKLNYNCSTSKDLYVSVDETEAATPSAFLRSFAMADAHNKSVFPILVNAEAPDKLHSAMVELKKYLDNGMTDAEATVVGIAKGNPGFIDSTRVSLPANARILLPYRPGQTASPASELLEISAFVNVKDNISISEEEKEFLGSLSFERLFALCDDAEEQYYLSEDNWKKIDELAEYLSSISAFSLNNKLMTAMERFVGVYMASGGAEHEALDAVLSALVLPAALTRPLTKKKSEEQPELSQFIDNCLGLEGLPLCSETLKKFNIT